MIRIIERRSRHRVLVNFPLNLGHHPLGKDWLYFACSPEEGSSDRQMTLIPAGPEDEDEEDAG
jgi:hypothetical protein